MKLPSTVMKKLRRRMKHVKTRAQFELIVQAAPHPARTRQMLEPRLSDPLPCCATYVLTGEHARVCPTTAYAGH